MEGRFVLLIFVQCTRITYLENNFKRTYLAYVNSTLHFKSQRNLKAITRDLLYYSTRGPEKQKPIKLDQPLTS